MINYLFKIKYSSIFFLIITNNILGEMIKPSNGSHLNYIHILFEWEEVIDAISYDIEISESTNFNNLLNQSITSNLYYLLDNDINWDGTYYWRVKPIFLDGSNGEWINSFMFNTNSPISSVELNTTILNESQYSNGFTIFGSLDGSFSAIIDKFGQEIWNSGSDNIIFYNIDSNNHFYGCHYIPDVENYLRGIQFSITDGIIWEEPNTDFVHHEIIQLPNGNYMGIASLIQAGPIPIGTWSPFYMASGYIADGITLEFAWQGDKIIEWDANSGEVVWEWNSFDHLEMIDYEPTIWESMQPLQEGFYEWTHMNALAFDLNDNSLILSSRHLSRIIKVGYPDGNIIWSMGHQMPSNDVDFGHEIGFSFQHSLEILDNGNIVFFDNGNLSTLFLETDVPLSRALEISINESNGNYSSFIEWEYILDENLFGFASGNVQKLNNENYLITTIGDLGTTLEVNQNHEIVWRADYDNGLIYRAKRINSLYNIGNELSMNPKNNLLKDLTIYLPKPNPFNPIVEFEISIEIPQKIKIDIYDIKGNKIESIINKYFNIGSYYFQWDASYFSSGIYFIKFDNYTNSITKKIIFQTNAQYYQTTLQIEYNLPFDIMFAGQYFKYDTLSYSVNNIDSLKIPLFELNFDPYKYFYPGVGAPIALISREALLGSFEKSLLDEQFNLSFIFIYDLEYKGILFETILDYHLGENANLKFIYNRSNGNEEKSESYYPFNQLEQFSHLRIELKYSF